MKVLLQSKLLTFCLQKKDGTNQKKKQSNNNKSRVSTSRFSGRTRKAVSYDTCSDSLFRRIQVVRDPKASVLPILQEWVTQGRHVSKDELVWIVRTMRDFKRFNHALEISLWITDSRYLTISPSDAAVRLDLIHRVHGLEGAENYFEAISTKLKTYIVYCSLLRGYVRENSVDKAEAIMQEMREMGVRESSFPYNMLIGLYTKNNEFDKIELLMQEMEEKRIPRDKYTLRNRMFAYIAASDVSGMENMLSQMERDPGFRIDWKVYSLAASGYLKLGSVEPALRMLRKLEEEIARTDPNSRKTAFMFLLTLSSKVGNKDELFRVWDLYKPSGGLVDAQYACMIRSLAKLGDTEAAERVFEDWESKCESYEFRVVNSIIAAYCKKGLLEKAERVLQRAITKGRKPYTSTWSIFANACVENERIPKAIDALKRGLSIGRKGWFPNPVTLAACLDYLKEGGDSSGVGEMVSLVKSLGVLSADECRRLSAASSAAAGGESFSEILCGTRANGSVAEEGREGNEYGGFGGDDEEANEILQ